VASFRIRCKTTSRGRGSIRVGDDHPRAVTLPTIGVLRVREDTRRLRRMLRNARVKILYATVSCRAGRWQICLTVQAADLHPAAQHPSRPTQDTTGWVGVDRGLSTYLVVATGNGQEVLRVADPPRPLRAGTARIRRLSRRVTGKQRGSANRRKAAAKLGRCHQHIRNIRQHFLHQVANQLVKTHDRIALEDLTITGMLTNHHLAAAISDAGWGELARIVGYKQQWRGGHLMLVDKWYPSTRACSRCHTIAPRMPLSVRVFHCASCGHRADRDLNAAVNLATWAEQHHVQVRDLEARGPVTNAPRGEGSDPRHPARVKPAPTTEEPNHHTTV
jgi:putative transposase